MNLSFRKISEAMEPVKKHVNKAGVPVWKFETDEFVSVLYYRFFINGKISMPEIMVKVYRKSDWDKAIEDKVVASPIDLKSVFMSKRDYAEAYDRVSQELDSNDKKAIQQKMFSDYVDFHYKKYQNQMGAIFRGAKKDLEAKEKYKQEETGLTTFDLEQSLNDFADMSPKYIEYILKDIKDKGYIRPALRGPQKGKLIPDIKAINRAIFDPEINKTPQLASALIAKQIATTIRPTSLWGGYTGTGFSWSGSMREDWWAREMVEKLGYTKDQVWQEEKPKALKTKILDAIPKYTQIIFRMLMETNKQMSEQPVSPPVTETSEKLESPNIIDTESIKSNLKTNLLKIAPFKSKRQRRWMYVNEPEIAKKWEKHTPKNKNLPEKVKGK